MCQAYVFSSLISSTDALQREFTSNAAVLGASRGDEIKSAKQSDISMAIGRRVV